jgi:hypothetical protein
MTQIRLFLFSCRIAQGGQGKYCFMLLSLLLSLSLSLLLTVSLTNFADVNDPLVSPIHQYHIWQFLKKLKIKWNIDFTKKSKAPGLKTISKLLLQ